MRCTSDQEDDRNLTGQPTFAPRPARTSRLTRYGVLVLLVGTSGVVAAGPLPGAINSHAPRHANRAQKGETETDALRMRVIGPDGVLVILDTEIQVTEHRARSGYLAFWTNFDDEVVYLYGRPLYTHADVGAVLFSLSREFALDVMEFATAAPALDQAIAEARFALIGRSSWRPATRAHIQWLIGERPSDDTGYDIRSDPMVGASPKTLPCCFLAITPPGPGREPTTEDLIRRVQKEGPPQRA